MSRGECFPKTLNLTRACWSESPSKVAEPVRLEQGAKEGEPESSVLSIKCQQYGIGHVSTVLVDIEVQRTHI